MGGGGGFGGGAAVGVMCDRVVDGWMVGDGRGFLRLLPQRLSGGCDKQGPSTGELASCVGQREH
jgi:hypothetical protein